MADFIVIDVQTNGLPTNGDFDTARLVSLAWRHHKAGGGLVSEGYYIVKPVDFVIGEDTFRFHGITQEKAMAEGLVAKEVLKRFAKVVGENRVLVAHNMDFCLGVLLHQALRSRMNGLINGLNRMPKVCTGSATVELLGMGKMPTFRELYRWCARTEPTGRRVVDLANIYHFLVKYYKLNDGNFETVVISG